MTVSNWNTYRYNTINSDHVLIQKSQQNYLYWDKSGDGSGDEHGQGQEHLKGYSIHWNVIVEMDGVVGGDQLGFMYRKAASVPGLLVFPF